MVSLSQIYEDEIVSPLVLGPTPSVESYCAGKRTVWQQTVKRLIRVWEPAGRALFFTMWCTKTV